MVEVILLHPEIPENTGNIARTCVVTNTKLNLVRPLGFSLNSKYVKRAGLDYWDKLQLNVVDSIDSLLVEKPIYFFSSKVTRPYTDIHFEENAMLIFGAETSGFPPPIWEKWHSHFYTIPMIEGARSLNLSNSVAIVLYEALRQHGFILNARNKVTNSDNLTDIF